MFEERLDDDAGERLPVASGAVDGGEVVQGDGVDPLRREHVAVGEVPFRPRHAEIRILAGVVGEFGERRRFQAEIHLDRHRAGQRLDHLLHAQASGLGGDTLEQPRGETHGLEITRELLAHPRPHHLDGDETLGARRACARPMHLRD